MNKKEAEDMKQQKQIYKVEHNNRYFRPTLNS